MARSTTASVANDEVLGIVVVARDPALWGSFFNDSLKKHLLM